MACHVGLKLPQLRQERDLSYSVLHLFVKGATTPYTICPSALTETFQ